MLRLLAILTILLFGLLQADAQPAPLQQSPQTILQRFYDWYPAAASRDHGESAWIRAVRERASLFDPILAKALRMDADAQSHVSGDIVGLDFDPFLGSQDPDPKYVVGPARTMADEIEMDVYGVPSGGKRAAPAVAVIVRRSPAGWRIMDFRYGQGQDLLNILKQLRDERQKH